jgi:hypothetical protein
LAENEFEHEKVMQEWLVSIWFNFFFHIQVSNQSFFFI